MTFTRAELEQIAYRHRQAMLAWLALLPLTFLFCCGGAADSAASSRWFGLIIFATWSAANAYAALASARLRPSLGDHPVLTATVAVLTILPGINLITIPAFAMDAHHVLRPFVGHVPTLGLTRRALSQRLGCCSNCGYSLAGLPTDRCPECGATIHPAAGRYLH